MIRPVVVPPSVHTHPKWLTSRLVEALHNESLHRFGGTAGIRDHDLLENILAHPPRLFANARDTTLFQLAAVYCTDIVRARPFVDGNERTGLLTARAFLFLNDYRLTPDDTETVSVIQALTDGQLEADILALWLAQYSSQL
ncbi:MAG: type II toxin-antitoxin system death-on-curing family toxin [Rhodothermales bacterium]